ncbi:MAG TPA: FHIPEP family type III secretion protein [Lachnospiraceae bacterium]|nr:FHIPEP family type III secretion protein [Lachnospiraceae bacterium]
MDIKNFSERLSLIRKERKLTQDEFATRIGVTSQAVSKWERGLSLPDIAMLGGISEVLGVTTDYLLGISLEQSHLTESKDDREDRRLLDSLCADPIEIIFGKNLIETFVEGLKNDLITEERLKMAHEKGYLMPVIRIRDEERLKENEYLFLTYDKVIYHATVEVVDDSTYKTIINKLFQVCTEQYSLILNRQLVKTLVDNIRSRYPAVVNGVVPERISYSKLQKIISNLADRKLGIHNLVYIIEVLEDEVNESGTLDIKHVTDMLESKLKAERMLSYYLGTE